MDSMHRPAAEQVSKPTSTELWSYQSRRGDGSWRTRSGHSRLHRQSSVPKWPPRRCTDTFRFTEQVCTGKVHWCTPRLSRRMGCCLGAGPYRSRCTTSTSGCPAGTTSLTRQHNKTLELSPKALSWYEGMSPAGARFALVIRRRNSTLCYATSNFGALVLRNLTFGSFAGGLP